ncbi:MAG: serine hydrolase [Kofleriaceae bacterium]
MRSLVIAIAFAASCGSPSPRPPQVAPAATTSTPPPTPSTATKIALPPGVPDTLAGNQFAWVIHTLQNGGNASDQEVRDRFSPEFLAQVPPNQLIGALVMLAKQFEKLESVAPVDANRLVAKVMIGGNSVTTSIAVDPTSRKIVGLLFKPQAEPIPKPKTIDEAIASLKQLAPRSQLLVASVDRGACKAIHGVNTKEPLAIGSTFKLYILLALADDIIAGRAKWEDEVAVRDDWKSLPTGVTQNDPAGTKLSRLTLAERMISISDNTATDHLLYTLGRENVEKALKASKHAKPALNIPFLGTRELFILKLALPKDEVARYLELTSAQHKREFLDRLAGKAASLDGVEEWKTARHIDKLEWFASSEDLCRTMAALAARGKKPAGKPVLDVLSKNPGVDLSSKASWKFVGYKGGSEPGVINMTWLLQRSDDKWFVVTTSLNGEDSIDVLAVSAVGAGVIDLLAADAKP